ncbi:MAG: YfcE family phosphodiesterase [Candidatus Coproplasma sp.]
MKKIVVISDTHGNRSATDKLYPLFNECDFVIHLGDTSSDGQLIRKAFGNKVYLLNGNCDFVKLGQYEIVLDVEGVKIFACHGDRYGVKSGYDRLAYKAEELGCSVALFGHTHCATECRIGNVDLFNPGTLSRYSQNSYLYLVIGNGRAVGKIVKL